MNSFFLRITPRLIAINSGIKKALIAMFTDIFRFSKQHGKNLWNRFAKFTTDKQIAIALSGISLTALVFASWTAVFWWTFATAIAWAVVYRKEATIPAIAWCWNESQPARKEFGSWLWKILSFGHGIPIAMIGWGVIGLILFALTLYFSKNYATMFGIAGLTGIIFGLMFYAIQLHNEKCRIRAEEMKARAEIARCTQKQQTNTPATTP